MIFANVVGSTNVTVSVLGNGIGNPSSNTW